MYYTIFSATIIRPLAYCKAETEIEIQNGSGNDTAAIVEDPIAPDVNEMQIRLMCENDLTDLAFASHHLPFAICHPPFAYVPDPDM